MSTAYWASGEVARQLDAIADVLETHAMAGQPVSLLPELTAAARRIVAFSDRMEVCPGRISASRAVLRVISPGEVIEAERIRSRLAAAGRSVPISTITVALHRAVARGDLLKLSRGQFRLRTAEEQAAVERDRMHAAVPAL